MLNGGARMVEQGLFERFPCDAIFAMHNMPGMPLGEFFSSMARLWPRWISSTCGYRGVAATALSRS